MSPQDSQFADAAAFEPALVGTAKIGAELRAVREQAGWKLDEVAAELRIRAPYLEAIERGDLKALPGPAYEVGFIRAYAQALGLDGDEMLRRFKAEGAGKATKPELSFLAPVPDRAVPTGAIVLLGVVILLVGYGLWFLHTQNERRLAAAVPAQLAPLAVPAAVIKPPAPAPAKIVAQKPVVVAAAAPAVTAQAPTAPAASSPPVTAVAAPGKTIQATADSWVEVRDASRNILFSRVMHAGDRWPVPDMPGLTMTAGNAAGTDIANNGTAGPPLGAAGTVVHNYALTAAMPATAKPIATPAPQLPQTKPAN